MILQYYTRQNTAPIEGESFFSSSLDGTEYHSDTETTGASTEW